MRKRQDLGIAQLVHTVIVGHRRLAQDADEVVLRVISPSMDDRFQVQGKNIYGAIALVDFQGGSDIESILYLDPKAACDRQYWYGGVEVDVELGTAVCFESVNQLMDRR